MKMRRRVMVMVMMMVMTKVMVMARPWFRLRWRCQELTRSSKSTCSNKYRLSEI